MGHIPFTIKTEKALISGFLSRMDKTFPPGWFHVVVDGFYKGQLLLNPNLGWWLPDSSLDKYAKQLGELVEVYYE